MILQTIRSAKLDTCLLSTDLRSVIEKNSPGRKKDPTEVELITKDLIEKLPVSSFEAGLVMDQINRLIDLSYVAGFFDGDGCVGLYLANFKGRKRGTHRLCASIVQNDIHVLEWCKAILGEKGGYLNPVKRNLVANRQPYQLAYWGIHAYRVLEQIRPFLVRKRAEADLIHSKVDDIKLGGRFGSAGLPESVWRERESLRKKLKKFK